VIGRAVVVGVGGLGAPAAAALARAGAPLTLIDPDVVEPSNLPRQPLFGVRDVGRAKVEVAAERIARFAPELEVRAEIARVDGACAAELLAGHAVVVDGTDGLATKDLLNRVAVERALPLVHAGAVGFDGQLMTVLPRETACLRCLFVELPSEDDLPTCQQAGVLGPVVGAVGFAAAREALAVLRGERPPLAGRFAILDGERLRWRALEVARNPRCPACARCP
jgi:molybdopterin/thiamine biosynthesis adenylyltransferase